MREADESELEGEVKMLTAGLEDRERNLDAKNAGTL